MSRRVATITLNPAYDLVGFCPEIERGEVNLVKTTGLHAAGKGINVAKVLKDLGIDVTVGGFLGKDNQDGFQQLFSELGIANRFQVVQGRTRINVKLTEKDGEVTDFNFSGFEVTPADWERFVTDSLSWLGQFDMVCVSGSLPSGVSPEAFTDWMTRLRSQCPCIIFDSSREALVAGLKAAPWLVKPNRRELEIWAGRKLPEMKDVIEAAHALREKDYVVIIGSANIDVAGYSHESLNYADSNPGKIKFTPGGVGRNIAQNLALLGNKAWLLSAVGSDFYGQSLLTQTNQSGVYVDKCLIVPGENTSSYLSLLDNTGEMLVAINDMNISNAITAEYLAQHREFIQRAKVIVADCNISEEALAWILDNAANVPVFVDPVSAWKCVKVRDRLNQIHTLKPNRLEAETLSGIALSGRDDVAKVAAWFHQHGLNRLVLSMGGDGVYYSDISGENGWSAPIKTNVINVTGAGDAMMAGLASCWVDGMPFAESVRFAQGCSSMALSCEYTNNPDLSIANVISLVENAECLN